MTMGHRMVLGGLLLSTCLLTGCRFAHKVGVNERGAPVYDQMSLTYELEQPLALPIESPIQTVSAERPDAPPEDEPVFSSQTAGARAARSFPVDDSWSAVRLHIQYPHPEHRPDFARVTLRLKRAAAAESETAAGPPSAAESGDDSSWPERLKSQLTRLSVKPDDEAAPARDDEIWALDISKAELDQVLIELARSGFFDKQNRPHATARISVDLDRGHEAKAWTTEAGLEALMRRVLREGWLAGLVETDTNAEQSHGWFL